MADHDTAPEQDPKLLAEDYARTVAVFALLADIRFKLLAFVPAIVGASVALVSKEDDQRVIVAVSLLGLAATIGILLYELRNSELYNGAAHRARGLEGALGLTTAVRKRTRFWSEESAYKVELWPDHGGVFTERFYVPRTGEPGFRLFGLLPVKHDRALALVYGAAIGGWVYLAVNAALRLGSLGGWPAFAAAIVVAIAASTLVIVEVNRHDNSVQMQPWKPRPAAPLVLSIADETTFYLDEKALTEEIKKRKLKDGFDLLDADGRPLKLVTRETMWGWFPGVAGKRVVFDPEEDEPSGADDLRRVLREWWLVTPGAATEAGELPDDASLSTVFEKATKAGVLSTRLPGLSDRHPRGSSSGS